MATRRSFVCFVVHIIVVLFCIEKVSSSSHNPDDNVVSDRGGGDSLVIVHDPSNGLRAFGFKSGLDLDMVVFQREILFGGVTEQNLTRANELYTRGGFVGSYARLTLTIPLSEPIPSGTRVTGVDATTQYPVHGRVVSDHSPNSDSLEVEYDDKDNENGRQCRVGALYLVGSEITTGCFAPNGLLSLEEGANKVAVGYTYSILGDNRNRVTLASISRNADDTMVRCEYCPFGTFDRFYRYYGVADYAHQFVQSALLGTPTGDDAPTDFSNVSPDARAIAASKGVLVLNVWMEVVRWLQDAVYYCQQGTTIVDHADKAWHSWNMAIAYYMGVEEWQEDSGVVPTGRLLYRWADTSCAQVHACGEYGNAADGPSFVNAEFLRITRFEVKDKTDVCADDTIQRLVPRWISLMTVPLVQNLIRSSFVLSESDLPVHHAEASAYLTALLPLLCTEHNDAYTLQERFRFSANASHEEKDVFLETKTLLERNYECLGIQDDCYRIVGGLYREMDGAPSPLCQPRDEPESLGNEPTDTNPSYSTVWLVLLVLTTVAGVAAVVHIARRLMAPNDRSMEVRIAMDEEDNDEHDQSILSRIMAKPNREGWVFA